LICTRIGGRNRLRLVLGLDALAALRRDERGQRGCARAGRSLQRANQGCVVRDEDHLSVPARQILVEHVVEGDLRLGQVQLTGVFELAVDPVLDPAALSGSPLNAYVGDGAPELEDVVDLDGAGRCGKPRHAGEGSETQCEANEQRLRHEHLLANGWMRTDESNPLASRDRANTQDSKCQSFSLLPTDR
jgi:hypothetical protein